MSSSEIVNYPELEQKLEDRLGLVTEWPEIGLIEIDDGVVKPQRGMNYADLIVYFSGENTPETTPKQDSLRIFLLRSIGIVNTADGKITNEEESAAVNPDVLRLLRKEAGLSDLFIAATCGTGHWLTVKSVFFEHKGRIQDSRTFEMFYEFIVDIPGCIHFFSDFKSHTYFCLNLPVSILKRFTEDLRRESKLASRLFYLDVIVADEMMRKWQRDMKSERATLKALESATRFVNLDDTTRELHRLSQCWFIHFRKLSDFEDLVRFIQTVLRRYSKFSGQRRSITTLVRANEVDESLRYLYSSCQSLRHLVTDYQGRTTTQINLSFHLTNQAESQASKRIAELTAEVAQKTQQDSTSMITIATVTMFFLPGTFIASFLNTVFFNFVEDGLKMSSAVWIFAAATIPLTIFVFGIWYGWIRWRRRRERAW